MIALSQVHATSVKSGVCLEAAAVDKIQPLIARFWWNAKAGRFCKQHAILSMDLTCPLTAECCLDEFTKCTALVHSTERLPCSNQARSTATRSSLRKAASASRKAAPWDSLCHASPIINNLPLGYAAASQLADILLLQLWSFE